MHHSCHFYSGARTAEMASNQTQDSYNMIVPESQDDELPSRVSAGTSQQCRANTSLCCSNGSISDVNSSVQCEPQETDFLLPVKLYGTSGSSPPAGAKGTGGSGAPVETVCSMVLQILVPFLLAGLGTVSAGILLEVVQVRLKKKRKKKTLDGFRVFFR